MEADQRNIGSAGNVIQGEFRSVVERLLTEVGRPSWRNDPIAKTKTIGLLQDLNGTVPEAVWDSALEQVRDALSITPERLKGILALSRTSEVSRALQFRPSETYRIREESVYPTDGWIGSYLLWAQASEVPLAWHFWSAVSILGAACRRNLYIDMGNHLIFPNHYVLLVGPSGTKKSTAIYTGRDVLRALNDKLELLDVPVHARLRELPNKVTPQRFLELMKTQVVTVATASQLQTTYSDAIGVFFSPELVSLLGKSSHFSDVMIHLLTDLYDCPERFDASTISRKDEQLRNVAISLIGGSTADWLRSGITEEAFGGGFMGRCIYVHRQSSGRVFPRANPLDPVALNYLADELVPWATLDEQEGPFAPNAWSWYEDWYIQNHEKTPEDPRMRGYMSRKHSHLLRLATILGLSMGRVGMEIADLEKALAILDEEEKRLPDCFGEITAHENTVNINKVMSVIWKNGNRISRTKLLNRTIKFLGSARALDEILVSQQQAKRIDSQFDTATRTVFYWITNADPEVGNDGRLLGQW